MIDKLAHLFIMFINEDMDINELQNRLSTIQCNSHEEMEKIKVLENQLEEIIYCCKVENQYEKVLQIINNHLN